MIHARFLAKLLASLILMTGMTAACTAVPPSADAGLASPLVRQIDIHGRKSDVWTWPAASRAPRAGTILFSHGAASAPWKYERLVSSWARAGYTVHAPLHVDSEYYPEREAYTGLASWKARMEDMHGLAQVLGTEPYVAAGHSYGALVALTLGGARPARPADWEGGLHDPFVKLVIAFSPPAPIGGFAEGEAYATLAVPAFIQTGTRDIPPGSDTHEGHLAAFRSAQPDGTRFALVLEGVDHYFGGAIGRSFTDKTPQLAHLYQAADLTLIFMAAYGDKDSEAMSALEAALGVQRGYTLEKR